MDNESLQQESLSTNLESSDGASPPPHLPPTPPGAEVHEDVNFAQQQYQHNGESSENSDSDSKASSASDYDDMMFHDEHADSADEEWVMQQLLHHKLDGDTCSSNQDDVERTDQRISCSRCFVTLSFQTQQHAKYTGQYRALIVRNCHVSQGMKCTASVSTEKSKTRSQYISVNVERESREMLRDVLCDSCGTRVGVHEMDTGIYHFCNVISFTS